MVIELEADAEAVLTSPRRLADLESSGLLDSTDIGALDALVQVAHNALGPDVTVLISAITADAQVIVSRAGGRGCRIAIGPMPLTRSMCTYVVTGGGPDVVDDTSTDPAHELVVRGLEIGAYLGFPLHGPRGTVLGAVCAAAEAPRRWTGTEVQTLQSLTTAVEFVVGMLAMARRDRIGSTGAVPIDRRSRIQHGLRTPLTSLLGLLELLRGGHLGHLSEEQLQTLERCAAHTQNLCHEVERLE
jgi:hypothetical protein